MPLTDEQKANILEQVRNGKNLAFAASQLGLPFVDLNSERKADPEFNRKLNAAQTASEDKLARIAGIDPAKRRLAKVRRNAASKRKLESLRNKVEQEVQRVEQEVQRYDAIVKKPLVPRPPTSAEIDRAIAREKKRRQELDSEQK